jgi:hypothetical protein
VSESPRSPARPGSQRRLQDQRITENNQPGHRGAATNLCDLCQTRQRGCTPGSGQAESCQLRQSLGPACSAPGACGSCLGEPCSRIGHCPSRGALLRESSARSSAQPSPNSLLAAAGLHALEIGLVVKREERQGRYSRWPCRRPQPAGARQEPSIERRSSTMMRSTQGVESSAPSSRHYADQGASARRDRSGSPGRDAATLG